MNEKTSRLGFLAWFVGIYFACNAITVLGFGFASLLIPGLFLLPVCWQRLNDMQRPGWLSLLSVVPWVNVVLWLALMVLPGRAEA